MKLKTVLQSGEVTRYHSHAGIDGQLLATHQWGVALIVQKIDPNCRKELLLAALTHDCAEYVTGDMPATLKWDNPEIAELMACEEAMFNRENELPWMAELSHEEKWLLKIADTLEGMCYCIRQFKLGHTAARRPLRNWVGMLVQTNLEYQLPPRAVMVIDSILEEAEKCNAYG